MKGGLLETGADGLYRLPVSSSPELHDNEAAAWVTPNSNYDLALLRYLYGTLADLSRWKPICMGRTGFRKCCFRQLRGKWICSRQYRMNGRKRNNMTTRLEKRKYMDCGFRGPIGVFRRKAD